MPVCYHSLDEAVSDVNKALTANGHPVDMAGTKKLLVSLQALGLLDWIDPKDASVATVDAESEARKVKV